MEDQDTRREVCSCFGLCCWVLVAIMRSLLLSIGFLGELKKSQSRWGKLPKSVPTWAAPNAQNYISLGASRMFRKPPLCCILSSSPLSRLKLSPRPL